MKLVISPNKRYFLKDDKPFFLMADTCWSAFTHPNLEEWREYLDFRKEQNFNAVQINLLPQRQSCASREWIHPFAVTPAGGYDYSCIQTEYFNRVCLYLNEMKQRDLQPMIVLLWGNFVPGTWQGYLDASHKNVEEKPYYQPMTVPEMENFLQYAVPLLREYDPMFLVSGDVNLSDDTESDKPLDWGKANPETVTFYYKALQITKKLAPHCLTTLHIAPKVELPQRLIDAPELDFYMYQPGHQYSGQHLNRTLAQNIRAYSIARPVYNSETCYEANIYFDSPQGRFDERQVRKAFWQGVLSGANAGFTYGAGGVWLWRQNQNICSDKNATGFVNDWRDDLRLRGAYDMGFAKLVADTIGLYDLEPATSLVLQNPCEEIVCAASNNRSKLVIYLPFTWPLSLDLDLTGYIVQVIDLETHWALYPTINIEKGVTSFRQLRYNHDYLIVAYKK
ncbi:MAG TPA: DUF4038 domain-containing protein [Clostridiales bacterium]|nr:DUF4038 domain-containing protein [Clostridiales bacterium]